MKTIILWIVICSIILYAFLKVIKAIFLDKIVIAEYQTFKKTTYRYSNSRLLRLKKNLLKSIKCLHKFILADEKIYQRCLQEKRPLAEQKKWEDLLRQTKKMLSEFREMYDDVEREISSRRFFNAQR